MSATGQFRPGQSGNPSGRPRQRKVETKSAFDVIVDKLLSVRTGGAERDLTVDEALQLRIYKDALAGKRMAIRTVLKWITKREEAIAAQAPAPNHKIELKMEFGPVEHVDDALQILGIATSVPERHGSDGRAFLLLEPWAVQRAFSRRSGTKLTDQDCSEIKRCARDPEKLRWPRGTQP